MRNEKKEDIVANEKGKKRECEKEDNCKFFPMWGLVSFILSSSLLLSPMSHFSTFIKMYCPCSPQRIGYLAASQCFHEGTDVVLLTTNMIKKVCEWWRSLSLSLSLFLFLSLSLSLSACMCVCICSTLRNKNSLSLSPPLLLIFFVFISLPSPLSLSLSFSLFLSLSLSHR